MFEWKPVTERVQRIREKYRSTRPRIDINRYRLVTEFYMENPQLTGILKRAKNLRNLFENMPVLVNPDEIIVVQSRSATARMIITTIVCVWDTCIACSRVLA